MVYEDKIKEIWVGKDKKVKLEWIVSSPNHPIGTVFFQEGLSGDIRDYPDLLNPLAEEYNVVANNHRAHAGSGGYFGVRFGAEDLLEIYGKSGVVSDGNAHLLSNSVGSLISIIAADKEPNKFKSNYMISPFLDMSFLPSPDRNGVKLLRTLNKFKLLWPIDKMIYFTGLYKNEGHSKHMLQGYAALGEDSILNHMDYNDAVIPTAYILTANDEVLKTRGNEGHYKKIKEFFETYLPGAEDRSEQFFSWNHEMNIKGDCPFLKPEKGKDSNKLIDDIKDFYEKADAPKTKQ